MGHRLLSRSSLRSVIQTSLLVPPPLHHPLPLGCKASNAASSFVSGLSPRNRVILLGVGVFTATAAATQAYSQWRWSRVQKQMIRSQVHFDEEKRTVVGQAAVSPDAVAGSLIRPLSRDQVDRVRAMKVSRRVIGPTAIPGLRITLLQYQSCPFCCRVRSLLDYYGLSYDVIEVNPVLRTQVKKLDTGYKKVPILIIDPDDRDDPISNRKHNKEEVAFVVDEAMQVADSSLIISLIASFFTCNPGLQDNLNAISQMYPSVTFASLESNRAEQEVVNKYFLMKGDQMDREEYKRLIKGLSEERKWREWADNVLVHTLSPNVYRTLDEAMHTFSVFDRVGEWQEHFATWERLLCQYAGAVVMWQVGKRLTKRHNLKRDVRESLFDATRDWLNHVRTKCKGTKHMFAGGLTPNLADITVFGTFHSIEGTDAFSEILTHPKLGPRFSRWYTAVKGDIMLHKGSPDLVRLIRKRASSPS